MKRKNVIKLKISKLILLLFIIIAASCSSGNDYEPPAPSLWLQLEEIKTEFQDAYSFSDFTIKIYGNKRDWVNDNNSLFSDKFNESGEMRIEESFLEREKEYYVDVFTNDNVLTNWGLNSSFGTSFNNILRPGQAGNLPIKIDLRPNRDIVGTWEFFRKSYEHENDKGVIPVQLTISKEFIITVVDSDEQNVIKTMKYFACSASEFNDDISIVPSKSSSCSDAFQRVVRVKKPIEIIRYMGLSHVEYVRVKN